MELAEEYLIGVALIEIAEDWGQRILKMLREVQTVFCIVNISFIGFDYTIPLIQNNTQFNN